MRHGCCDRRLSGESSGERARGERRPSMTTALASIAPEVSERDSDTRTTRFIRGVAESSLGDGVCLGRAGADLHAASESLPLERPCWSPPSKLKR